jgi:hypothetical protein
MVSYQPLDRLQAPSNFLKAAASSSEWTCCIAIAELEATQPQKLRQQENLSGKSSGMRGIKDYPHRGIINLQITYKQFLDDL